MWRDIVEVLKNIAGATTDDDTGFPFGKALYDLGLKIEDVLVGGVVAACGRLDDALIGAALFMKKEPPDFSSACPKRDS